MSTTVNPTKSRLLFWLFILIDIGLWVAAFSWRPPAIQSPPIVSVNIWPGTETLIAARESGRLPRRLINFVEMSWSSSTMRAFGNRAVDVAVLTLSEVQLLRELGHPLRVLMVVDESVGADALVARSGTPGVAELRGKKIGVELRSGSHYLLGRALEESGMTFRDVQVVPLILPETETAFEDLGVDAVVTAEPWLTRIKKRGGVVLYDSTRVPGEIQRILVTRSEVVESSGDALRSLIDAHFESLDPETWSDEIGLAIRRREGVTVPEFADLLTRVRRFSREEQTEMLAGSALRDNLQLVFNNMERLGLVAGDSHQEIEIDASLVKP